MKMLKTWTTAIHYDDKAQTVTIMYPSKKIEHVPTKVVRELPKLLPVLTDCCDADECDDRLYESGHVFVRWNGYNFLFWDDDFDENEDEPVFYCNRLMLEYLWEVICEQQG